VVLEAGRARVWVLANGRLEGRDIVLGAERGADVEVREGLAGGERVVLRPATHLRDGARVRVARPRN
jgi:multidrug efflux pump subunit AcrA (membrane-fusion protein)